MTLWGRAAVVLCGTVAAFFLFDSFATIASAEHPPGRDGYYYVVQAQSFLASGRFHYPSASPLSLAVLSIPIGLADGHPAAFAITGLALVSAAALMTVKVLLTLELKPLAAMFAMLILSVSGLRIYFVTEFLANLVGVCVFLAAALALTGKRLPIAKGLGLAIVAMAAHPSAGVATTIMVITFALCPVRAAHGSLRLLFALATVAGALTVYRILVSPIPFPFAAVAAPETIGLSMCMLLLVGTPSSAGREPDARLLAALVCVVLVLCLNPFLWPAVDAATFAVRMGLWSWVLVALVGGMTIQRVWTSSRRSGPALGALSAVALLLLVVIPRRTAAQEFDFIERQARLGRVLPNLTEKLPETAAVVSEHGLQFMVTSKTGIVAVRHRATLQKQRPNVYWLLDTEAAIVDPKNGHWAIVPDERLEEWWAGLMPNERRRIAALNRSHFRRAGM